MQVGTTKDQGLNNKFSVEVHPGALAAGLRRGSGKLKKCVETFWLLLKKGRKFQRRYC